MSWLIGNNMSNDGQQRSTGSRGVPGHTKVIALAGALCVTTLGLVAATPGASASNAPTIAAKPFHPVTRAPAAAHPGRFVHAPGSASIQRIVRTPAPRSQGAVGNARPAAAGLTSGTSSRGSTSYTRLIATPAAPTQLNAFAGTAQAAAINSFGNDQGVAPPDPNLAVGPYDVLEATNSSLSFYRRDGTLEQSLDINSFAGHPCGPNVTDARVVFDPSSGRFYFTVLSYDYSSASASSNCVIVLASPPANPAIGPWTGYTLRNTANVATTRFPNQVPEADQPGLGFSDNVVAVAWNYFGSVDVLLYGSQIDVVQKSDLISGVLSAHTADSFVGGPVSPQPVVSIGSTGVHQYVVANDADKTCTGVDGTNPNSIAVFDFTGQPEKGNVTAASATYAAVTTATAQTAGCRGTTPAPQSTSGVNLQTDDDRLLNAVWQNGVLWTGGNTDCTPSGDTTVRTCLNIDSVGATNTGVVSTTATQYIVGVNGSYLFYPAISVDRSGNAYVVFDQSTGATNESVMVAGITGGGVSPFTTLQTSSTWYDPLVYGCSGSAGCRWGDYAGAAQDPSHPNDVWVVSEDTHGDTSAPCTLHLCWNTDIGRYTYPQLPLISGLSAPTGPISGGRTVTVNGSDFLPGTTATFGGAAIPVTNVTPDSFRIGPTPAGAVGSFPAVRATDSAGPSPPTAADQYIYGHSFSNSGMSDLAAVNSASSFATTSTGTAFGGSTRWGSTAFFGTVATLVGDVNGDGMTDLMAVNTDSVWVELSTGTSFAAPVKWSGAPFTGSKALLLADVSGDGKADLVAVNNDNVWVIKSTGTGFTAPGQWSVGTPFYGGISTMAGDLTGTGKAALLAVNNASTYVMTSTGTSFNPPAAWSTSPFFGSRATVIGDVSGDGKADLLALNNTSTYVMTSTGTAFSFPTQWSSEAFYGSRATLLGDLTGTGHEDLIAVNDASIWVKNATSTNFQNAQRWSSTPFYGALATFAGG